MWLLLAFAALVVPALQGTAIEIVLEDEAGVRSVAGRWRGVDVPFVKRGATWRAVVGVDLEARPGVHDFPVTLTLSDGRRQSRPVSVNVRKGVFPTTRLRVDERFVELKPEDAARAAAEARELDALHAKISLDPLWESRFEPPIAGAAGRNFGHRRVFNGKPRNPHGGADLRAATGDPIRSTGGGRVVLARDLFFTGGTVLIDHGLGIYSLYAHLSAIRTRPGDVVTGGAVIGLAGATGRVTGPHLHWGVKIHGARVDPFSLVKLK